MLCLVFVCRENIWEIEENGKTKMWVWVLLSCCFHRQRKVLIYQLSSPKKNKEREKERGINLKVVELKSVGTKKAEEEEEIEALKL